MFIKAENLNEAFIALSRALVESGVNVTRRGFQCREIPSAVLIEITNPIDRYVRIPERKWNKTLGWIESLWIARGDNCLDMPAAYVKNLKTFSDDGEFMRAGYGPRIRRYGDNDDMLITTDGRRMRRQYKNGKSGNRKEPSMYQNVTDQLRFVVEKFKEDIDTREAAITIHDPISDDFDGSADYSVDAGGLPLLKTKDTPCTRSIHFMVVNGKMNCYVDMRSNDCFTYNTKIPLLNGEVWELGRLAEEKFDEKFWVYSRDENGRIVPGLAHHPRKVRRVSEIMKITLDNGEVIECTPDHRFMLLNGEYKEVKDIEIGESLSPLYRRHNDKGYEEIFYHDRWEKTHKISYEAINGRKSKKMNVIHHKDFNKRNNNPENLIEMTWDEHLKLHQELICIWNSKLWNPDDPEYFRYESQRLAILRGLEKGSENRWSVGDVISKKEKQAQIMVAVNDYLWNKKDGFREFMKGVQSNNGRKNLLKLWESSEFRDKISKAASKRLNDFDVKELLSKLTSERNRKNWKDPKYRDKIIKSIKEAQNRPEVKEKQAFLMKERSKKLWEDKNFVEFQRKTQRVITKKQWENPEYRKNQIKQRRIRKFAQVLFILKRMDKFKDVFNEENYEIRRFEMSIKYPSIKWVKNVFGSLEEAKAVLIGNHKIISKEILKKECDVYDLTVNKYHNFALESGVFVHNCVWGFSAVNVFNFTLMQEYIAAMVGVPVGSYFHKADNLHVYQEFLPLVEQVAKKEIGTFPSGTNFTYTPTYKSLKEFDYLIKQLSSFESMCREGVVSKNELRGALDSMFQDELFSDWAKVIFRYWTKETVEFKNPLLNELFN